MDKSISMEEYLDKVYEGKEVVYTYKVHDYEGNREFWKDWCNKMMRANRYGFGNLNSMD